MVQKILIIGGTGVVGSAVASEFKDDSAYEVLVAGRSSGLSVTIEDPDSVEELFKKVGAEVDHVVVTAGGAYFGPVGVMKPEDWDKGFKSKFGGQANVVLIGSRYVKPGTSFTLTSGTLAFKPLKLCTALAATNSAVNAFARTVILELTSVRVNVVSPGLVTESLATYGPYFQGFLTVPVADVAKAYRRSIAGGINGKILRVDPAHEFVEE
eukprot:TRINITY_DN2014_c0_g1_i1.p1 TRINITY_DN2014_c0_g1~~TRINITY_DN2014_c0_g1_i1.p1  ORF type:complete len:211 (+),score=69.52 TRINITY_DN2014_c0_g1_i1:289-921(+)